MAIPLLKRGERIRGGEVLSRMLAAEGVEVVFGIIDGTYFGLYSTFAPHGIRLVTPRHETSGAHMAGAYARSTGRLGVCLASNGPGVANVLPGVAVENAEGNRVLLITSSRRVGIAYPERGGTFQYFPQVEVTRPMTKWSCAVPSIDRLAELMRRALRECWTGRPGVVHLDVPESVMNGTFDVDPTWFRAPEQYRVTAPMTPAPRLVEEAARLLREAKRPVIHAGSGVVHAGAHAALARVAALCHAPMTTSWGARAALDERDPLAVSMSYVGAVDKARKEADLVLVLGSRLGETDWWGKAPYWGRPEQQRIIQVDLDAAAIGNNRPVDVAVQGDIGAFLEALAPHLGADPGKARLPGRRKWAQTIRDACAARRAQLDDKHLADRGVPMAPAHVATVCREVMADDAVLVIDGGNTAIWANFFHEGRTPGAVLGTPKMGMLGAGVAQALGAQVAHPDRRVYCILGDGAMGFQQQEIETAIRNELPVIYIVLCDRQWGMVKINQCFALKPVKTLLLKSLSEDETINSDLSETRFDELARSMGAHGERVGDPDGLAGALERSLRCGRCAVIHVDVDPVKHLWAPNLKTFKDMHEEPAG